MTDSVIEIHNLKKNFGDNKVLKGISTNFHVHETVGIMGANGCGKTTFLSLMCQTLKPSSGKIQYHVDRKYGDVKYQIGAQFQEGEWPSGVSAYDMIQFYKGVYPSITKKRINELIDVFEIREFWKRQLQKLSGGQKQRFNAFLAVIHNPQIVFFDEVTTGLDIELQYRILNYLKGLAKGKQQTIFIVSHGPEEVEQIADRVILIDQGLIWVDVRIKQLLEKYGSVRKMMNLYFEGKINERVITESTTK